MVAQVTRALDSSPVPAAHVGAEPPVTFWQHPFVQNIMPFLTSMTLHVSLILISALTVTVVTTVIRIPESKPYVPAEMPIVKAGSEDGLPPVGTGGDPTRMAAQDKYPEVPKDPRGWAVEPGPNLIPTLAGGGSGDRSETVIGIGLPGLGKGWNGIGGGEGNDLGPGKGSNRGVQAPFGVPGGGVPWGKVGSIFGPGGGGGGARRIVYVCDATGSMVSSFDQLRMELRKAVQGLTAIQSYNVIFFQGDGYTAADKRGLLPATPENKRRVNEVLDRTAPAKETNPLPALELAFSQKPDLIFLLTDGDFSGPGNDAVVQFCKEKGKGVKINTIAFISRDNKDNPQDQEFVKALQSISTDSGGKFKFVQEDDLGR